jgi:putative lipoprotein
VLLVQLEDVSTADGAALVIAEATLSTNGAQVPLAYRLTYSAADIVAGARYQIRATITSAEGVALFTTTQAHPIIPEGGGIEMGILVQPVPLVFQSIADTEWVLVAMGEMLLAAHDGDSTAYLVLQRDGRIAGSTGCNRFFGGYTLDGEIELWWNRPDENGLYGTSDVAGTEFRFSPWPRDGLSQERQSA